MRTVILTMVIVMFAWTFAVAQDTLWARDYGFPGASELGLCGCVTSDGGYAACGVSYYFSGLSGEFWLVRLDSNGDTLWTRNYGGSRWQEAHYITQTSDGGFAICGGTNVAVGDDDMFIVKTDATGDTMWTRRYGTAGADDDGWAIIQTSDDGYLAAGHNNFGGSIQLFMVRLGADGSLSWMKRHGGAYSDYGYGVVETADQGFALTGTYSTGTSSSDLWLLRTDSLGDMVWSRTFDFHGGLDRGDGIVLAPDGGFAIGGRTWEGTYPQLLVLRTDSLGIAMWSNEFGTSADEFAESIDMTPDGGFVIGGGAGPYPFDYYIVKVDANGDSLWAVRFDGPAGDSDDCYEVRVDPEGYIMAFGYSDVDPDGYDPQYWMLKIQDTTLVQDGYLAGLITEQDGSTPVSDVNIEIYNSLDSLIDTGSSDIDGEFLFALSSDTYSASFSKADYVDTSLTGLIVIAAETTSVSLIMYPAGYAYLPGDANMSNGAWPPQVIGGDVTYLVNYFRALPSNPACLLGGFYCSADANGDCTVIGSDVTRMVSFFRGLAGILYCPDCDPLWLTPDDLPDAPPDGWPNCE